MEICCQHPDTQNFPNGIQKAHVVYATQATEKQTEYCIEATTGIAFYWLCLGHCLK